MKLLDILKTVGGTALNVAFPGVGTAVTGMINAILPSGAESLPGNATGAQIEQALNSLPADQRAKILEQEIELDLETIKQQGDTLRTMLIADEKSDHTTRPQIALGSFRVVTFGSVLAILIWCVAILKDDPVMVKTVQDGWPFVLSVLSPFVILLRSYFGILKAEHKNRLDSFTGQAQPGAIASIIKALKK